MKRRQTEDRLSSYQKRFRRTYLAFVFLLLVFIAVFSLLVRQRIKGFLDQEDDLESPAYEVFPYHSLAETTRTEPLSETGETLTDLSQPGEWPASQEPESGFPATTGRPPETRPTQGGTPGAGGGEIEVTETTPSENPSAEENTGSTVSTEGPGTEETGSEASASLEESSSSGAGPGGDPADEGDPGDPDDGGGEGSEEG